MKFDCPHCKQSLKTAAILVLLFAGSFRVCAAGTNAVPDPARMSLSIPMGFLGHRLGTYLTIEGVAPQGGDKTGGHVLRVDTVNGKKLETPVGITISGTGQISKGERCVFNGYESGGMMGIPDEVAEKEHLPPTQADWQFARWFVVTSIVEPKGLKKE